MRICDECNEITSVNRLFNHIEYIEVWKNPFPGLNFISSSSVTDFPSTRFSPNLGTIEIYALFNINEVHLKTPDRV